MGAALYTGLLVLILGGFMNVFIGRWQHASVLPIRLFVLSSELTETAMAVGGALLFSLFIIYDTQVIMIIVLILIILIKMIMTRLSPEEYIVATIQLYLDIVNLVSTASVYIPSIILLLLILLLLLPLFYFCSCFCYY